MLDSIDERLFGVCVIKADTQLALINARRMRTSCVRRWLRRRPVSQNDFVKRETGVTAAVETLFSRNFVRQRRRVIDHAGGIEAS